MASAKQLPQPRSGSMRTAVVVPQPRSGSMHLAVVVPQPRSGSMRLAVGGARRAKPTVAGNDTIGAASAVRESTAADAAGSSVKLPWPEGHG